MITPETFATIAMLSRRPLAFRRALLACRQFHIASATQFMIRQRLRRMQYIGDLPDALIQGYVLPNGCPDGPIIGMRANGTVDVRGYFAHGRRYGKCLFWHVGELTPKIIFTR